MRNTNISLLSGVISTEGASVNYTKSEDLQPLLDPEREFKSVENGLSNSENWDV